MPTTNEFDIGDHVVLETKYIKWLNILTIVLYLEYMYI